MTLSEVNRLIAESVQIGVMQAIKTYEPARDCIRASELRAWLSLNKIDYGLFRRLEEAGLVKKVKQGNGTNSPMVYSKAEVKQAVATSTVCGWLADGSIDKN